MSSRVPPLDRPEIDADVVDRLRSSYPRVGKFFAEPDAPPMPPILGLLARHPGITGPWLAFSGALLDGGVLDARTRELLILATARRTANRYVWNEHVPMAEAAGVATAEIDALDSGTAQRWTDVEAALLRAVDELIDCHRVADATWAELARQFDDQAMLEVLFVVGAYGCLAMVLNSTGLGTDTPEESS